MGACPRIPLEGTHRRGVQLGLRPKLSASLLTLAMYILVLISEGGFGDDGLDVDILGGDEEGGGWDVGDEDLVLPPDLVGPVW